MKLSLGGVRLKRLKEQDLEMLRTWRNDPKIRRVMFFQEHITRDMQLKWFTSLSELDYYFVIETGNEPVGLIHLNIDEKDKDSAFAGLFIHDDSYWGTQVPVYSSLALLNFAFKELDLKQVLAKVRKDNSAAIRYNQSLGFSAIQEECQVLTKNDFFRRTQSLYDRLKKEKPPQ